MKEEIWLPVKGYELLYEISSHGNVRRILYRGKQVQKNLKPKITTKGYLNVALRNSLAGTRKWFLVHRLVGIAFIANPENKPQINHEDGNKENNYFENLKWATAQENIIHSFKVLKKITVNPTGENNGKSKLTLIQVKEIKRKLSLNIPVIEILKDYPGIKNSCISHIKFNRNWKNV